MKLAALLPLLAVRMFAAASSVDGLWDATVVISKVEIPFRIELKTNGPSASGSFFNGAEPFGSSSGSVAPDGAITVRWDHLASKLTVRQGDDGSLSGVYDRASRSPAPFHAKRFAPVAVAEGETIPQIAGSWTMTGPKSKLGETAWPLILRQSGAEITGALLRVDGDTGGLTGVWRDGKFTLSHFSGARPVVFEVRVTDAGTLDIVQDGSTKFTAVRADQAKAKGLPEPADPSRHTYLKNPDEPLRFSGVDLDGRTVSEADPRFQGKVVIVSVGGSWCPNCHDEAPLLVEFYAKYRSRGLEIVNLSFEEGEEAKNPNQLRAFRKRYGITYPVLVAGEPSQLAERLPQAVNLNTFPASFILGRDGRVRSVHAGFAGPAMGELHEELRRELTATIEGLLRQ